MIKRMNKAELIECLGVIEEKLDIIILTPRQLGASLDKWLARDEGMKSKAIRAILDEEDMKKAAQAIEEGAQAIEKRTTAGVSKINRTASFRRNWIIDRASAIYCDDSNELNKINSVQQAAQEYKDKYGGEELKPKTLQNYRNATPNCTDQGKDKNKE